MEIDFLHHFEFPKKYSNILKKYFGKHFLPLQEKGIQQGKLFEGNHLLVQAPTSSGKTMLAELLFLYHVQKPKNTLLLVPTKALANQRYQELQNRYQSLGLKICLSTRDHPAQDNDIRHGDFHLAVIVYEKLSSLLIDSPELLSYAGACVMDELHYVLDAKRGRDIDLLLTRIMQESHIQRMGLSAIQLDDSICQWLGMQRLETHQRPVELRQGVLCQGKFYYQEFNSKNNGIEELPLADTVDDGDAMLEAAEYFYHKNESTLLFFPTRNLCYTAARHMAKLIDPDQPFKTDAIDYLEDSSVKNFLHLLLPKRIAIHTSDLTTLERELVESLIQQNEIRVIFATSTLAEGINFPVTNVITTKHMYAKSSVIYDSQTSPCKVPITYDRLQNMTGRAGRFGYKESGRGMIVSCYAGEIDGLMKLYIPSQQNKQVHPIVQTKTDLPLLMLKLFALFRPLTADACYSHYKNCYCGSISSQNKLKQTDFHSVFQQLIHEGFIDSNQDRLYLTGIGHCVVTQGISLSSATEMINHAKLVMQENQCGTASILVMLTLLSEIMEVYVPVSHLEIKSHAWTKELRHKMQSLPDENTQLLSLISTPSTISIFHHCAFKKTVLCMDWMNGRSLMELENKYRVYSGLISRFTSEMAWLIQSFTDILNAIELHHPFEVVLNSLKQQLLYGIPKNAIGWMAPLQNKWVTRQQVLELINLGYSCPSSITQDDVALLASILPFETVSKLTEQRNGTKKILQSIAVKIDTSRPDQFYVEGNPVRLTKMQSQLIHCLSHQINRCVQYDKIMNELWGNGMGDRKGLNRLKNQITQKCVLAGGSLYQDMIEVVPGVGMVLHANIKS